MRRRVSGLLDRVPFRRKLDALFVVPLTVVAVLLGYTGYDQIVQARAAAATAQLVRDSAKVAELVDAVQTEHRQALVLSLRHAAAAPEDPKPSTARFRAAQHDVDSRVEQVRSAFGERLPRSEAQALRALGGLTSLRRSVEEGPIPADNVDPAYGTAVDELLTGLGFGDSRSVTGASASGLLDALLRADTAHAAFETSVFSARTGDPNSLIEFTGAVGDYEQYTYQARRFTRFASQQQGAELAEIERSAYQAQIAQHYAALQVDPSGLVADSPAEVKAALREALRADPTYERQARNRLRIVRSLIGQIAAQTERASDTAWWRATALLGGCLLAFAGWITFTWMTRRSMIRTVAALTGAAESVAEAAKRELARVDDTLGDADDDAPPRLPALPVPVRDEIGALAEAFNQVQVTSTDLLERQIVSRRNIAEMFGNVGRRVSNLTARQLALIDSVERGETDPSVLERLYRIDHIAVRLQRNADSLMLLAGVRDASCDAEPTRLSNVVRAALGQIESYQRVSPRAEGDALIAPDVVGDLTLMLAELLENAVTFSPEVSRVDVVLRPHRGGHASDGATVEIIDHGLGMSDERLAEENARLVRRERLDLMPTKVLGLFVVGSLARRWGIRVVLGRTPGGGTTATVTVPATHLLPTDPVTAAPLPVRAPGTGWRAANPRAGLREALDGPQVPAQARRPDVAARGGDRDLPSHGHHPDLPPGLPPGWFPDDAPESPEPPGAPRADGVHWPDGGGGVGGSDGSHESGGAEGANGTPASGTYWGAGVDGTGSDRGRPGGSRHDIAGPDDTEPREPFGFFEPSPSARSAQSAIPARSTFPARSGPYEAAGPSGSEGSRPDALAEPTPPHHPDTAPLPRRQRGARISGFDSGSLPAPGTAPPRHPADPPAISPPARTSAEPVRGADDPRSTPVFGTVPPRAGATARPASPTHPAAPAVEETPSVPPAEARPLRRRVRGATLQRNTAAGAQPAPCGWQPRDAEATRAEIEQFEAAVARARYECRLGGPQHPAGAPGPDPTTGRPPAPGQSGPDGPDPAFPEGV
ncbi:ATP-binding protein [Streptomyces sp. NPDC058045]|uniref:HAMP domain-containing sensor histidine kinase n=1 Tax=Streptomyces sp. NPDC058045 TaxID=3346311 RepID=UPI0036EC07D2